MRAQCALLGLPRSSFYYQAEPESAANLFYMRLLDEEYTRHPFYGVPRMTWWLRQAGYGVGPKRVRRLLRLMGLMAVYPKPHLSLNPLEHRRFPYLLRGVNIQRPNQVWSTDITYIRPQANQGHRDGPAKRWRGGVADQRYRVVVAVVAVVDGAGGQASCPCRRCRRIVALARRPPYRR